MAPPTRSTSTPTQPPIPLAAPSPPAGTADNLKKNGKGTIEALNNARIAADAVTAEATAAKAANASNHRELAANAAKERRNDASCLLHAALLLSIRFPLPLLLLMIVTVE